MILTMSEDFCGAQRRKTQFNEDVLCSIRQTAHMHRHCQCHLRSSLWRRKIPSRSSHVSALAPGCMRGGVQVICSLLWVSFHTKPTRRAVSRLSYHPELNEEAQERESGRKFTSANRIAWTKVESETIGKVGEVNGNVICLQEENSMKICASGNNIKKIDSPRLIRVSSQLIISSERSICFSRLEFFMRFD